MTANQLLWQLTERILKNEFPDWAKANNINFIAKNCRFLKEEYAGQFKVTWFNEENFSLTKKLTYSTYEVDVNVNSALMTVRDADGEDLDTIDISIYFR